MRGALSQLIRQRVYAQRTGSRSSALVFARWNSTHGRQWSTPLAKNLAEAITTTGPVPIASYMRHCLTAPNEGYYTSRIEPGTDQFGKRGDFITSPEISQVFGELVGIWFVAEWMAQGKPSTGVQLIELGPGRGTLMSDVLRTIRNFKPMASALDAVYLVEASSTLREAQKELLCGPVNIGDHEIGYKSTSQQIEGLSVVWTEDITFLPRNPSTTSFIIAHEFFDALPIHAFQSVVTSRPPPNVITSVSSPSRPQTKQGNEWRELVVSVAPPPSVINPPKVPGYDFQLTLAPAPTRHSQLLPVLSPRYKALLNKPGTTIEVSPNSQSTAAVIAQLIGKDSFSSDSSPKGAGSTSQNTAASPLGAALIIDYGPSDTIPVNSLRGIRSHKRVSPFDLPGQTDLSVDVDFGALVEASLAASENVEVHGPVEQGEWLRQMGGEKRVEMLATAATKMQPAQADDLKKGIESGWKRLVDRGASGMGRLYKVMGIVARQDGQEGRRPVGFGGDI